MGMGMGMMGMDANGVFMHPYSENGNGSGTAPQNLPGFGTPLYTTLKSESPQAEDEDDDHSAPVTPGMIKTDKKTRKTSRAESQAPYSLNNGSDLKMTRQLRKNTREKQRRLELNDQFETLCNLLNLGTNNKTEKFAILSQAIDVISSLRQENIELRREKTELRAEMGKLALSLQNSFPAQPLPSVPAPATAASSLVPTGKVVATGVVKVKQQPQPQQKPSTTIPARDPFLEEVLSQSDLHSDVLPDADLEGDVFDDEVTPNDEDVFGDTLETNSMDDELI